MTVRALQLGVQPRTPHPRAFTEFPECFLCAARQMPQASPRGGAGPLLPRLPGRRQVLRLEVCDLERAASIPLNLRVRIYAMRMSLTPVPGDSVGVRRGTCGRHPAPCRTDSRHQATARQDSKEHIPRPETKTLLQNTGVSYLLKSPSRSIHKQFQSTFPHLGSKLSYS